MKNLRISPLRCLQNDTEQNPMDSLANLADLMLVFACGLMISIVANWNIDLGGGKNLVGLDQGAEIKELDGLDKSAGKLESEAGYEEMGVVYKDPRTGKLYMVTK